MQHLGPVQHSPHRITVRRIFGFDFFAAAEPGRALAADFGRVLAADFGRVLAADFGRVLAADFGRTTPGANLAWWVGGAASPLCVEGA